MTIIILASLKTEATNTFTPILGTFILYLETQNQTNSHAHSAPLPGDSIPVTGYSFKTHKMLLQFKLNKRQLKQYLAL